MSLQRYKTVYFGAGAKTSPKLTLAFGRDDETLYQQLRPLASLDIRAILGHQDLDSLRSAAAAERLPTNKYCLRRLAAHQKDSVAEQIEIFSANSLEGIAPVLSTFRGGASEPLHQWFPLAEGYSPAFVESILRKFLPSARSILDPFGGIGTTPITAARSGLSAFYCEINPVFRSVVKSKGYVIEATDRDRSDTRVRLLELASTLKSELSKSMVDADLPGTYGKIFGGVEYFRPQVFSEVLRARRWIDALAIERPLDARLVELAVLRSLMECSLTLRRGDVRFRTQAEMRTMNLSLADATAAHLGHMIADIARISLSCAAPVLLVDDARKLVSLPSALVDAVVTSPPYLNGTNYCRNTKLEMWFLRALKTERDLASLRAHEVTAGINSVTHGDSPEFPSRTLEATLKALEGNSYDPRIPRMVRGYAADMDAVFAGLAHHLQNDGLLALDIGDSCYGSVHVPTDRLLTELASSRGFTLERELTLRRRKSRDGRALRQVLLIFRRRPRPPFSAISTKAVWSRKWASFKEKLPHASGAMAKRNWGHPRHSLCSYQGKMKPALAASLVSCFLPEDGRLLDPFAGVGTIPFEAALRGAQTWAFDISPAAVPVSRAKLGVPTEDGCNAVLAALEHHLLTQDEPTEDALVAASMGFNGPLASYFSPKTFREVLLSRRFFLANPPEEDSAALVFASLLHILHGNRPYALSRHSHPLTPFAPTGPFEYRPLMPRLRSKVSSAFQNPLPRGFKAGRVVDQDALDRWPEDASNLDAIITSPPFFDSTRFYLGNWIRLWFAGWEARDFRERPRTFMDERQKKDLQVYGEIFRQARERLKPRGVVILHLGRSRKCNMGERLASLAQRWFRVVDLFDESVEHCESHGVTDKGTIKGHQYLVLQ